MFDLQVPFFNPLWLRIVTVLVCVVWAGVEVVTGSIGFAMIFAAVGLYAGWQFFVVWDPKNTTDERNDDG